MEEAPSAVTPSGFFCEAAVFFILDRGNPFRYNGINEWKQVASGGLAIKETYF
ncbi:MAG: hypothetical protein ACI4QO_05845 [Clostridia bacterium]